MDNLIVHVKKDTMRRQEFYIEEQTPLSRNSTCEIELTDAELEGIYGGTGSGGTGGLPTSGLPLESLPLDKLPQVSLPVLGTL